MADSDNTTSLPFVTHRGRDQVDVSRGIISRSFIGGGGLLASSEADPVLLLAESWHNAHKHALELCERHQVIETKLIAESGSVSTGDGTQANNWAIADRDLSYSAIQAAERRAVENADLILRQLTGARASSLQGVIAKLEVVLSQSEIGDGPADFPWPQIRSAVADLKYQLPLTSSQQTSHTGK